MTVPFWRRDAETLNERLAREAGLSLSGEPTEPLHDEPEADEPRDVAGFLKRLTQPISDLAVIHGAHRAREWDVVAAAEVPGIRGDSVHFVALPEGGLVVDEAVPEEALDRLADAVEGSLPAPYRAEAVRRGGDVWAIGARRTSVVELPTALAGDDIELAVHDGDPVLTIDGRPSDDRIAVLEDLAATYGDSYVARASRLDERRWEVDVFPL
ncbi:MAG TPA: hypothetical protein VHF67_08040 [Gaiellaceae bacterium]|nr:hypothetical protein [Gaiellaceae bacterium]